MGKELSLEEVLELKNGEKIYVEELNKRYANWSGIHTRIDMELISDVDGMVYELKYLDNETSGLKFYEVKKESEDTSCN